MSAAAAGIRSRMVMVVAGILAAAAALAGTAVTNAAWVDDEYVHASGVGTDGTCSADSGAVSTASARQLSGTLLGSDLDNLAALQGVQVSNDGAGTSTPSAGATRINDDTYMAPLDLDLLTAEVLQLSLPLGLPIGSADIYSQWSQTLNNGNTTGASGFIANSGGGISLGEPQDSSNPPLMATIDLARLVPVALAGMTLDIGAVSSIAELTRCGDLGNGWLGPLDQPLLNRDYSLTLLDLNARIPAVGSAVTGVGGLLNGMQPALDAAAGELASHITGGLSDAAGPLLGILQLGDIDAQVTMTPVNLAPVRALLTGTLTDQRGLLTVDLDTGTVRVDLAKTAGGANGLNSMEPNTEIVLNPELVNEISAVLAQVLGDWREHISSLLTAAVRSISVTVDASVVARAAGLPLAEIGLGLGPVAVGNLLDLYNGVPGAPAVPVTTQVTMLGSDPLGFLAPVVAGLASGLSSELAGITAGALNDVLISGLVNDFGTSAALLLSPAVDGLTSALQQLSSLMSIMVNVQPDQPGYPGPATASPFEITALRLALVEDLNTLELSLATASVG